jgi:hypothetical protein
MTTTNTNTNRNTTTTNQSTTTEELTAVSYSFVFHPSIQAGLDAAPHIETEGQILHPSLLDALDRAIDRAWDGYSSVDVSEKQPEADTSAEQKSEPSGEAKAAGGDRCACGDKGCISSPYVLSPLTRSKTV